MEIECINKCGNLTDIPESNQCATCRELHQIQPLIPISFKDVEIEKTAVGNIVHIFTDKDPNDLIETIVKALYHTGYAQNFKAETDEMMKENDLPEWLVMAFTEVNRMNKKSLQDATKNSLDFMAHYEV